MQKRILIADEELLGAALSTALTEAGYAVEHVLDGDTALQRICEQRPDLILMSAGPPRLAAWEILAQYERIPARNRAPVVLMSSSGVLRPHHLVNATLAKPFDLETLLITVAQALSGIRTPSTSAN